MNDKIMRFSKEEIVYEPNPQRISIQNNEHKEMLDIYENGDIHLRCKLVGNDKELFNYFKHYFLKNLK